MHIATSDRQFYITFKHWNDGAIRTEESQPLTFLQEVKEAIDDCREGEGIEVIQFNPVEGWSKDVTEDVVNDLQGQSQFPWEYIYEEGLAKLTSGEEVYTPSPAQIADDYRRAVQ